jgi:hypothetical protein
MELSGAPPALPLYDIRFDVYGGTEIKQGTQTRNWFLFPRFFFQSRETPLRDTSRATSCNEWMEEIKAIISWAHKF